jgi:hypothetical protein
MAVRREDEKAAQPVHCAAFCCLTTVGLIRNRSRRATELFCPSALLTVLRWGGEADDEHQGARFEAEFWSFCVKNVQLCMTFRILGAFFTGFIG